MGVCNWRKSDWVYAFLSFGEDWSCAVRSTDDEVRCVT